MAEPDEGGGAGARVEQRHQDGDSKGPAHLPAGLIDGAADCEAIGRQARHGGRAQHGKRQPDTDPHEQQTGKPNPDIAGPAPVAAYQHMPVANNIDPTTITGRKPIRAASRPAGPDSSVTMSGAGVMAMPAFRVE